MNQLWSGLRCPFGIRSQNWRIAAAALFLLTTDSSMLAAWSQPQILAVRDASQLVLEWRAEAVSQCDGQPVFPEYQIEESNDLVKWEPAGDSVPARIGGAESVHQSRFPITSAVRYFRIRSSLGLNQTNAVAQIEMMKSFTVREEARVSLYLRLTNAKGDAVSAPEDDLIDLLEGANPLSPTETLREIDRDPEVRKYSLLLVDLSGSVTATPSAFAQLYHAAEQYLKAVMQDEHHFVAVRWFAGTISGQGGFSNSLQEILQQLRALENVVPNDRSTNLHGAFVEGHNALHELDLSNEYFATLRHLVVLTDGREETGLISAARVEALVREQAEKDNGTSFYAIGIGNDIDHQALTTFGVDGAFFPASNENLEPAFLAIAASAQKRSRGIVLVEYESARRAGIIKGTTRIQSPVCPVEIHYSYNASGFTSPSIKLQPFPEDTYFLPDSGVPVRYWAGKLYAGLEHRIVGSVGSNWRVDTDRGRQREALGTEYPFYGVLTVARPIQMERSPSDSKVMVEIRDTNGRILKRSEPLPFTHSNVQSYFSQDWLGSFVQGQISDNGKAVWYPVDDQIYELDRATLEVRRLPVPLFSSHRDRGARRFAFVTNAALVADDDNNREDLYLWDREEDAFERLTALPPGQPGVRPPVLILNIADDGSRVFLSSMINLQSGESLTENRYYVLRFEPRSLNAIEFPKEITSFGIRAFSDDGGRAFGSFFGSGPPPVGSDDFPFFVYTFANASWFHVRIPKDHNSLSQHTTLSPDGERVFIAYQHVNRGIGGSRPPVDQEVITIRDLTGLGGIAPVTVQLGSGSYARANRNADTFFYLGNYQRGSDVALYGQRVITSQSVPLSQPNLPAVRLKDQGGRFMINAVDHRGRFLSVWSRYKYRNVALLTYPPEAPFRLWVIDSSIRP